MARYINHAAHPHPLELREGTAARFRCALCRCRGRDSFYSCNACDDFRVHDTCAAWPETFSFFGHQQHPLALYPVPVVDSETHRCCDLCRSSILGAHHGCRLCGVFLHPVCARLPPAAVSPVHPQHLVTLVPSTGGVRWACESCDDRGGAADTQGWHYVCAPCGVRLHPWCLLGDGGEDDDDAPLCIRGPCLFGWLVPGADLL